MWLGHIQTIGIVSAVLLAQASGNAPRAIQSGRTLLGPCDDCVASAQEGLLDVRDIAGGEGGVAVFRICSSEPLPVAIVVATQNPVGLGRALLEYYPQFTPDRILIQRSTSCRTYYPHFTPVEMWGVPSGASLPPAEEQARLSQFEIEQFNAEGTRNRASQQRALERLVEELRRDTRAVGVIRGFFYRHPSVALRRSAGEARRFLQRCGILSGRYFIRSVPSLNEYWGVDAKRYPDVFLVRLASSQPGGSA